ncbi:hypothetical protein [Streptomyces sp. CHB9.2]|uniref:hypothetical protein n=1 Tax=Streptomyces sp. CHB9.2 TaxID=2841670 RepID=UPI0020964D8B|nr:hypothetical protein [Streptomyces sp. CHB9.2]MCO6704832.1 hypothetical protein [Streptomyces sp. CHB9.2]
MANLSLSVAPGYYLEAQQANWVLSSEVDFISFALNGAQPALSKYIAYDTLTPANPFIAVTEDGNGRVVYDGGFPKFYNSAAPTAGLDPLFSLEFRGTKDSPGADGNAYYYDLFSTVAVTIAAGDKLVYDIWCNSPDARVGVDGITNTTIINGPPFLYSLRDWKQQGSVLKDQNNISIHPASDHSAYSANKWYHREFDLTQCAGATFVKWSLAYEGETNGVFYTRFKEVYILDSTGKVKATLFKDRITIPSGTPNYPGASGYSDISTSIYDPRKNLSAAFKYLFNAIRWVSKKSMEDAGIKKILILGDATPASAVNYRVKGTGAGDFFTSLTNLCTAVGFTPTFKDASDYAGGVKLNATLAEMNQYNCVLVMSSLSTGADSITTSMIQDILTYRQQGGGVILITDHGPVINDISGAYPTPTGANCFFTTANAIAVNFGAWFSGTFDRVPVNVGFLRANYGDHPLYEGMTDAEDIAAGFSESKVMITNPTQYRPPIAPVTISKQGVNTLRAMVQLKDGTMEAYSFVYVIASGQLILFKDGEGTEISALPTSLSSKVDFDATLVGAGLGTLVGDIQLNGVTVAQLAFTDAEDSSSAWIGGGSNQLFVKKGDVFKARITSPFSYTRDLPVNRLVPTLTNLRKLPDVVKELRSNGFSTSKPKETVLDAVNYMTREFPALGYTPKGDYARDIAQLQGFWSTEPTKPDQGVYIYQTLTQAQEAMGRLSPPTPQQVFNTWDRFFTNEYFVGGVGATGDAASWAWNDSLGAAVQSVNSATWNGFISPDVVDSYELDVVIKSDNADDDTNGIILAFNRANGVNHRLILALNQGGNAPAASHSIGLYSTTTQHLVLNDFAGRMSNAAFPTDGGWRGKFSRVKVTRSGNYFKVLASQWNSLILDPASLMELTLDDTALQAQFKGPKPWGFINYSQSQSYFTLRSYKGGPLKDVVVVAATGAVYFYGKSGWELIVGTTAKDVFGYPRKLTNPETGASFMVNANGTITAL